MAGIINERFFIDNGNIGKRDTIMFFKEFYMSRYPTQDICLGDKKIELLITLVVSTFKRDFFISDIGKRDSK
ncbi:hypothetical protein DQ06_02800 [Brachyspira hampsonii bv. II]|nr:hypothetical protein DQ06_02800 [Brachyspira hampsonii bv. II]